MARSINLNVIDSFKFETNAFFNLYLIIISFPFFFSSKISNLKKKKKKNFNFLFKNFIMLKKLLLILLIITKITSKIITKTTSDKNKTISLFILSRHGHRYSLAAGEDDNLKGQLSTIGLRTNYLLGKYIKKKFSDFFNEKKFNSSKNEIIASGLNRNKMSTNSFFLGLYDFGSFSKKINNSQKKYFTPEFKNVKINNNFDTALPKSFQPVPVFSFLQENNFWFEGWNKEMCPRLTNYNIENSSQQKIVIKKMNDFLPILKKNKIDIKKIINKNMIENVKDVNMIYDFIFSEVYLNKLILDKKIIEKINILGTMSYISYLFNNDEILKFQFTLFVNKILGNLTKAVENDKNGKNDFVDFTYLNGHDTNLLTFLKLLGLTNFECLNKKFENDVILENGEMSEKQRGDQRKNHRGDQRNFENLLNLGKMGNLENDEICLDNPKYSSAFIFELYKNEENKYFINLFLNGEKLKICDKIENCEFSNFVTKMKNFGLEGKYEDLKYTYCLNDYRILKNHGITIFFLLVNLILIGIVGFVIYKKNKNGTVY